MARGQSASLDRRKLFSDPVMMGTIVLLIVFLTVFILYPLAVLLVDSVYSDGKGLTFDFFAASSRTAITALTHIFNLILLDYRDST